MNIRNTPKKIFRKIVHSSERMTLSLDDIELPTGKVIHEYHVIKLNYDTVIVLLTNNQKELCFVQVPRYTTQRIEWEMPAGGVKNNEDILEAAKRETLEETGYALNCPKLLYTFNPSNGICSQNAHVVWGTVGNVKAKDFDTDEIHSVHWISIDDVKKMINTNEIKDGYTLTALLVYFLKTDNI